MERVEAGDEIVLARNGRPVAKIVPLQRRTEPRVPGALAGKIWIADDFDDPGGEWGESIDEMYRNWESTRRKRVPGRSVRTAGEATAGYPCGALVAGGHPRLGGRAQSDIADADEVLVSAVSGYEIAFKQNLGKLESTDDLDRHFETDGFRTLHVTLAHALLAGRLPVYNQDPFDRLLVAQARCEGLTLVTADRRMSAYEVPILDATR